MLEGVCIIVETAKIFAKQNGDRVVEISKRLILPTAKRCILEICYENMVWSLTTVKWICVHLSEPERMFLFHAIDIINSLYVFGGNLDAKSTTLKSATLYAINCTDDCLRFNPNPLEAVPLHRIVDMLTQHSSRWRDIFKLLCVTCIALVALKCFVVVSSSNRLAKSSNRARLFCITLCDWVSYGILI